MNIFRTDLLENHIFHVDFLLIDFFRFDLNRFTNVKRKFNNAYVMLYLLPLGITVMWNIAIIVNSIMENILYLNINIFLVTFVLFYFSVHVLMAINAVSDDYP